MPDDRLRKTVALMYGGKATFVQFVPVRETFGAARYGKAWCTSSTWPAI